MRTLPGCPTGFGVATITPTDKMGSRRKARELALQMLFQADLGRQTADQVHNTFWEERSAVEPDVQSFTEDIFRTALKQAPEMHQNIDRHAEHCRMDRKSAVDCHILSAA